MHLARDGAVAAGTERSGQAEPVPILDSLLHPRP
jgi:hypothetical protein